MRPYVTAQSTTVAERERRRALEEGERPVHPCRGFSNRREGAAIGPATFGAVPEPLVLYCRRRPYASLCDRVPPLNRLAFAA